MAGRRRCRRNRRAGESPTRITHRQSSAIRLSLEYMSLADVGLCLGPASRITNRQCQNPRAGLYGPTDLKPGRAGVGAAVPGGGPGPPGAFRHPATLSGPRVVTKKSGTIPSGPGPGAGPRPPALAQSVTVAVRSQLWRAAAPCQEPACRPRLTPVFSACRGPGDALAMTRKPGDPGVHRRYRGPGDAWLVAVRSAWRQAWHARADSEMPARAATGPASKAGPGFELETGWS